MTWVKGRHLTSSATQVPKSVYMYVCMYVYTCVCVSFPPFVHLYCFLNYHVPVKSYGIYFFLADLFYLALYTLDPSMLLKMAIFHSFFYPWIICNCMLYHAFFIHSSTKAHFHNFAIINNALINIGVHRSFQVRVFIFFG